MNYSLKRILITLTLLNLIALSHLTLGPGDKKKKSGKSTATTTQAPPPPPSAHDQTTNINGANTEHTRLLAQEKIE